VAWTAKPTKILPVIAGWTTRNTKSFLLWPRPDDPAVPVIERLQTDFPRCSIRLIKGTERIGTNRKVNSLYRLVQEAKYDLVVMSDSDVRVDPDYLGVVVPPFADPPSWCGHRFLPLHYHRRRGGRFGGAGDVFRLRPGRVGSA